MNISMNVSVIIPAFNVEAYLAEALDSVLAQIYPASEIIIVNDGSTDGTLAIAHHYAARYPKIRVICQLNEGISTTRNRGISASTGEILAFLDSDDYWYPNHIQQHVLAFLASPTLMLSFGRVEFVDEHRKSLHQFSRSNPTPLSFQDFYLENPAVTASNLVLRRSILDQLGGFDIQSSPFEDQELCLRIIFQGGRIEALDPVTVQYRIRNASLSSDFSSIEKTWIQFQGIIVQRYSPALTPALQKRSHSYFLRYLARRALRLHLDPTLSFHLMKKAIAAEWQLLFLEPRRTIATLILASVRALRLA
jgi:glycosyltransferase involved in cell wall biosynthesis